MPSEQSAATVSATLPAAGAAIGEITERFYAAPVSQLRHQPQTSRAITRLPPWRPVRG
ncbi:hypothetical protein [Streptomyces sp. MMG1121]|uniref:hypothetical protein n=1 Tax=Streptomyces sp. MMG1121 TaxID=1415544 RepID=UPI00131DE604|nr:hypothetical protein [Streptomyces sp. MMG1121]